MKTLNRYIASQVVKGCLSAILVVLTLLNFFSFADELGELGQGDYGLLQIFQYLALTTPRNFHELMPSAALVGGLVALGSLSNNRELVAMQAAGVSRWRIIRAALIGGMIVVAISIGIGELIAPESERAAHAFKAAALKKEVATHTKYGVWVRDGNVFSNIRTIQAQEKLADINIYQISDDRRLDVAMHARSASYDGNQWKLRKISRTYFGSGQATAETVAESDWSSVLAPSLLNAFVVHPDDLSVVELSNYLDYLIENGQQSLSVELAFWGRIANPIITVVMLLLATPFVLSVRREVGVGHRIVVGVIIGLGFYLFDRMFSHFGLIYDMNPIFAAIFPASLALAAALFGLSRVGRH